MDIIEHDGEQYIRAEQKSEYVRQTVEEIRTLQSDIDDNQSKLDELITSEIIEERQQKADELLSTMKDIDKSEAVELFDFEDEAAFNTTMDYFQRTKQADHGDPSAGFGDPKRPQSNTKKQLYEQGRQAARDVRRGKR